MIGLAVEVAKLSIAEAEILQAVAAYRSAVDKAKSAAEALGANWEGDARETFMAEQEKAYNWHMSISDIVSAFAEALKSAATRYERVEQEIKCVIDKC